MNKNVILKYFIIVLSVILTLTGIVLWVTMQSSNNLKENTVIKISGETNKNLKSEIKGLYPGKTVDYVISLKGETAEEYFVSLNFHNDNGGELKKYVVVAIVTDNGTIQKTLEELLDGEPLSLGQGVTEIKLSYAMPIDTGDEAQGASVVFYVELNAKNVEQ
ncbi:MAG: hypothetical protein IKC71_02110 [Clostridia bacterium]|nr:hypothetical protein [Clostridia bacterium]